MPSTKNKQLILVAICLALCMPTALAFWRLPCGRPISVERTDPIVNPGKVAGHVHTIMGASGFSAYATTDSIQQSQCSTCKVKQDMSNYWIPTLWYQYPDGTMEAVPQDGGVLIYYLQRKDKDTDVIEAFPKGLRMIAGSPMKFQGDSSLETRGISYACLNFAHGNPETPAFPQQNCPNGLRTQVFFPSCWDGVNIDSPDHKSHMAYPSSMDNGYCPSTHPHRLISLFFEVTYNQAKYASGWLDSDGKPFRAMPFFWSSGDNTGFSLHGDFLNGWDVNVLQQAVNQCTDGSGVIELCQPFNLRSDDDMKACKPEYLPSNSEAVFGRMNNIPNVAAIPVASFDPCGRSPNWQYDNTPSDQPLGRCFGTFTGQAAYTPVNGAMGPVGKAADPLTPVPNPIDQTGYLGCFVDGIPTRTMEKLVGTGYTPATCRQAVKTLSSQYVVFGIQYGGECWATRSATSYNSEGVSTRCNMACNADPTGWYFCGGPNANQAYLVNA